MNKITDVAVAVIVNKHKQVLISLRPDDKHLGGHWEFPGGKFEKNETPLQALCRELYEELNIKVNSARPLIEILHHYQEKTVYLHVWKVDAFQGVEVGSEGQEIRWVNINQLEEYEFPAADKPILNAIRLPERYLVTGNDTQNHDDFIKKIECCLLKGRNIIQLRAKQLDYSNYKRLACAVIPLCHQAGCLVLLNSEPQMALDLKADGVHLSSQRLNVCDSLAQVRSEQRIHNIKHFYIGASCHSAAEIKKACQLGCDYILLSPVKKTISHPQAKPIGYQ